MSGTEMGEGSGTGNAATGAGCGDRTGSGTGGIAAARAAPLSRAGRPLPLRPETPPELNMLRGVKDGPTFAPFGGVPNDEKYARQSGDTDDGSSKNDSYSSSRNAML